MKAEVSRDEDQSADFMRVFPSFVWAVRDFTLELKKGDDQITSDEYLESALKLKTGVKKTFKHIQYILFYLQAKTP